MFEILVKRSEDLTAEEDAQLDETSQLAFAGSGAEDLCWSNSEWFLLGKFAGRVVSIVGILYREIRVGDGVVIVGGVGGVATHPEFQRRGFAGMLMQRAGALMGDEGKVSFGLLNCAPERMRFYGSFGWQPLQASMFFYCHGERRLYNGPVMILPISGEPWPDGEVDLMGGPW